MMSRWAEQPAIKLGPVLEPGEDLLAAAHFEHPLGQAGPNPSFARYWEARALQPGADLAYRERATNGYLGITGRRLILAKSPVLFKVKQRHVFFAAPVGTCTVEWSDERFFGGAEKRTLYVRLDDGRFASIQLPLSWPGLFGEPGRTQVRELADGVIAAFGERATRLPVP